MFEVISTFKNEFCIIYRSSYLAPAFINHNVENLLYATGDTYLQINSYWLIISTNVSTFIYATISKSALEIQGKLILKNHKSKATKIVFFFILLTKDGSSKHVTHK